MCKLSSPFQYKHSLCNFSILPLDRFELCLSIQSFKLVSLKNISHLNKLSDPFSFTFKINNLFFIQVLLQDLLNKLSGDVQQFLQLCRCFQFDFFFNIFGAIEEFQEYWVCCFHLHFLFWRSITMSENTYDRSELPFYSIVLFLI